MDLESFLRENEDWRPHADLVALPPHASEMMTEFTDVCPEVLARCMEFVSEGGGFVTRGAIYMRIRHEEPKSGDKWASMLCLQQPPGIQTSDTFWAGRKPWHELCTPEYAAKIKQILASKGTNIMANDEYMPELARFPGDPEAVVPFGGGRSYIKSLCQKRGWGADGAVTVEAREPEKDLLADENCPGLSEKTIRKKAASLIKKNPELGRITKAEMRDKVLRKFGPSK